MDSVRFYLIMERDIFSSDPESHIGNDRRLSILLDGDAVSGQGHPESEEGRCPDLKAGMLAPSTPSTSFQCDLQMIHPYRPTFSASGQVTSAPIKHITPRSRARSKERRHGL